MKAQLAKSNELSHASKLKWIACGAMLDRPGRWHAAVTSVHPYVPATSTTQEKHRGDQHGSMNQVRRYEKYGLDVVLVE
jgi:hypothetical protein